MDTSGMARRLGVAGLLAVAAVHANWARGSAWPLADRHQLARAVAGRAEMPPAAACLAIAGLLSVAAGLVAGVPRGAPRLRRLGATGVVAVLTARGVLGAAGLTPQQADSATFAHWDRRLFSPLCLALAACCAAGIADS